MSDMPGTPRLNGLRTRMVKPRIGRGVSLRERGNICPHSRYNICCTFRRDRGVTRGEVVIFPGKIKTEFSQVRPVSGIKVPILACSGRAGG